MPEYFASQSGARASDGEGGPAKTRTVSFPQTTLSVKLEDMSTHTASAPLPAAIYARVSTTDKGQTNENQILALRAMAATRGWEIVAEYADTVSGAKVAADKRKQFPLMMEAARRGEFSVLLVFSIDRLTRKGGFAAIDIVRQLSEYNVKVASYVQQYLDPASPFYATLLAMAGDLAAMERNTFVERVHAGLKRARREGRIGGRPKAVVNRDKIRARYAAGESQPAIAEDLGVSVMTVNRICRARA